MSDEEDYNSEEDADYVPSDGELGSEEENSGEEEDLSVLADDAGTVTNSGTKKTGRKKQKKNDLAPRKRKGGIHLQGEEERPEADTVNAELAQNMKEEEEQKKLEKEKKRADDLWSSFLTDVKPKAKPSQKVTTTSTSNTQVTNSSSPATAAVGDSSETTATSPAASHAQTNGSSSSSSSSSSSKITITKVFDFAGEEIKVTKEVAADSKEAKAELKKQEQLEQHKALSAEGATSSSAVPSASPSSAGSALLGAKRPAPPGKGGLGNVLNKIGKKTKMGTLEKSQMDWESFKKKEGIEEDLKIHNKGKDGYIERMSFLNRTDLRQFEIERDLRLNRSGKR